jgi:hypothetical protein
MSDRSAMDSPEEERQPIAPRSGGMNLARRFNAWNPRAAQPYDNREQALKCLPKLTCRYAASSA